MFNCNAGFCLGLVFSLVGSFLFSPLIGLAQQFCSKIGSFHYSHNLLVS